MFEEAFPTWAHTVVTYCKETQNRTSLKLETDDYDVDIEDGMYICYMFQPYTYFKHYIFI